MMDERKLNLQLFATDEDDTDEFADYEEEEEEGEDEVEDEEEEVTPKSYRTQEEVDSAIEARLARERKKLAKMFGVERLEDAAPYLQAGQAVSRASGLKPGDVVNRLGQTQQQQQPYRSGYGQQQQQQQQQPQSGDPAVLQRMDKIETLLETDREEKVRKIQENEVRKEFGKLYDEHRDAIEDKAEDTGLSLLDAATIVLRPKLREHIETTQRKKRELKGKRKVESSAEGPIAPQDDVASKLSSEQKRVADKQRISYKDYYEQLKALGRVE